MSDHDLLSFRELEILELVATGASNKVIAVQLDISVNTVKVHLQNIFRKLEVNTRTEAALYAVQNGYFDAQQTEYSKIMEVDPPRKWATTPEGDSSALAAKRSSGWTLTLALIGIVLLGLVGMFILLNLDGDGNGVGIPDRFPVESERWQPLANLPTPRSDLTVVTYEDNIFAIGGLVQNQASGALERYDPKTDSWYSLVNKPLGVYGAKAAVIGGLIYVPGGETAPGQPTDVVEVYDPREQVWSTISSIPTPLSRYSMVSFEGKLYVFGGWDGLTYKNTVYSYDPQTNSWLTLSDMPTLRAYAGAAVAGGDIYIIGGFDGATALSTNEVYSPELEFSGSDPWRAAAPLPAIRYAMGVESIADIIHVIGGKGGDGDNKSYKYIAQIDAWQPFESPMRGEWSFLGLVHIETYLYGIGGMIGEENTGQSLSYRAMYSILLPIIE